MCLGFRKPGPVSQHQDGAFATKMVTGGEELLGHSPCADSFREKVGSVICKMILIKFPIVHMSLG